MPTYSPVLSFLTLALGAVITVALAGGFIIGILAAGKVGEAPGKCRNVELNAENTESPGLRDALTDPTLATQWQQRWDQFNATLDTGSAGSVTFEEGEATSRVAQWIDETDAPLSEVTICFYAGIAQAGGHANIPILNDVPLIGGLFETDVRVLGRIELGGEQPRIRIAEMDAGDFPDWMSDPIKDDIEEIVNERLADLTIRHRYTVTLRESQMEITGEP